MVTQIEIRVTLGHDPTTRLGVEPLANRKRIMGVEVDVALLDHDRRKSVVVVLIAVVGAVGWSVLLGNGPVVR